jgi:carboxyl-terminal processing protease
MQRNTHQVIIALVAIFVIVTSFSVGVFAGRASVPLAGAEASTGSVLDYFLYDHNAQAPEDIDLTLFWKVWNLIDEKYVTSEMPNSDEKLYGAIEGLVSSLGDPYSTFMPPIEAKMFEDDVSGSFEGVGMEVGIRDGILSVISPLKGTPADKAGLMPGDKIIQIDELPTYDLTLNEAVDNIRGPGGTTVTLTIVREGEDESLEVPIVRTKIDIPVIDSYLRDDGVFVIELYSFYETAPSLFTQAIKQFTLSGSHNLVLDLRNNPGGYLEASVDIAGNFLPSGKLVVKEDFGDSAPEIEHRTRGNYLLKDYDFDMVVLMNGGSASASEILAGALSEHGVATLVGEQSFGKGSVQELIKLDDGTSLKLTIARWLTPNGVSISEQGLKPDVEAELTIDDIYAEIDPQMDTALEVLGVK